MIPRRHFLQSATLAGLGAWSGVGGRARADEGTITLPFENGSRTLATWPQKRPLIQLTTRPPQLETPFSVFNEGVITPNDAFFVRYHLPNFPLEIDEATYRLEVKGKVKTPLSLSLDDLKKFEPAEVIAVNQCSGNSRGFVTPRVPGGQYGNGAMGNAKWKGVRLKDVLEKAGLLAGAKQVVANGLDTPVLPQTPDFQKAFELDHAMAGEILLAYEMNGEPLPMLNGYPIRMVVPGYYGTYWLKHLSELTVVDEAFGGFFMATSYRIPANEGACVEPGTTPTVTVPINRYNVRSFITSIAGGQAVPAGRETLLRGIAFDGGHGIAEVLLSADGGHSWQEAALGKDFGRYSFREWTLPWKPAKQGEVELKLKATNRIGDSQPLEALWNPAGYMRNVVETLKVRVTA